MSYLSMTVLNRQAKEAFKANKLIVGILENYEGETGLTIVTLHSIYWIEESNIPNKVKAIVADLMGFIPSKLDELWEGRDKDEPQIVDPVLMETLHKGILEYEAARTGYIETGVSIRVNHGQEIRLIQNREDLHIKGIKQEFLDVIDVTKLDYDIENAPVGPIYGENGFIYYSNATTLFITQPYPIGSTDYAEPIVDTLTLLDLEPSNF